jgi:adenylate cyclase
MKYGVVGRHVNLTSRIQSYTTGGQILISETTRREAGSSLKLGKQTAIKAKGIEHTLTVCDVLGIGGRHRLFLSQFADTLVPLAQEIPFTYAVVEGSHLGGETLHGRFTKLSHKQAQVHLEHPTPAFTNLKIHVIGSQSGELPGAVYAKVLEAASSGVEASIRFTSVSPAIEAHFSSLVSLPGEALSLPQPPTSQPNAEQQTAPAPAAVLGSGAPEQSKASESGPSSQAQAEPVPVSAPLPAVSPEKKRNWLRALHRQ